MAYRNGTYIAFHAGGTTDPTSSDIKYYRMLKAWHEHDDIDFKFIDSHEKVSAVRDTSSKTTLMRSLKERLNNSRNMVLIIGPTTRFDTDWVPFEVAYAVDTCQIPIIAAYTGTLTVMQPATLRTLWPSAFRERIDKSIVKAIHIPFNQKALDDAISRFDVQNPPDGSLVHYTAGYHRKFGVNC